MGQKPETELLGLGFAHAVENIGGGGQFGGGRGERGGRVVFTMGRRPWGGAFANARRGSAFWAKKPTSSHWARF